MSLQTLIAATECFYEWELRGRGWRTYAHPVRLEPAFSPFRRLTDARQSIIDDGRRHSIISSLFERAVGRPVVAQQAIQEEPRDPPRAEPAIEPYTEFELLVPPGERIPPATTDALIRSCMSARHPLAYELLGMDHRVSLRICTHADDAESVRSLLRSFLPGGTIREADHGLSDAYLDGEADVFGVLEFGLAHEFMLPLRPMPETPDPLQALLASVSAAGKGARALLQVVFEPAHADWASSVERAVTTPNGEPFFLDAPELTEFAMAKCQQPLFAVLVRALVLGKDEDQAGALLSRVAGSLGQYGDRSRNSFVPLVAERGEELIKDLLTRSTCRSGMLLSLAELASLVRLPGEHVRHDALIRTIEPENILPKEVLGEGVILGDAGHRRSMTPVRLNTEARLQHTHVIGGSGTGKSTLLVKLILEDIDAGRGVGVVDPHGDLVDEVLGRIPRARRDDVILLDPSDPSWSVGWNILGANSEIEKELLASDLVAVFKRLSTSWGDQMSAVLGNAVLAFLESKKGGTLSELRKFLLDETFRLAFLATVEDDHVVSFWKEEFPLLAGKKPQAPILTRLDTFLRSRLVRSVVTERDKALDFREILDGGKIFLAKLSQGAIGEENAALLGSLIVSKFHQTALSRQDTARTDRRPFFLFLDEFHELATPSMASLFSGVRKYNLGLCVAHQDLYQLHANAPEVERAVLTNAYTRVVFRAADEDARKLEREFGDFAREDFAGLERGEAIVRVGKRENSFKLKTRALPGIDANAASAERQLLREVAMERYGRPRMSVSRRSEPETRPGTRPLPASAEPAPSPPQPRTEPEAVKDPGRGGAMHKYLQGFIRETAHARGFRAEIEKELTGGQRVDVLLSAEDVQIACEVGGITTLDREVENLRKCLDVGFTHVCAVSLDAALLKRLAAEVGSWPPADRSRIQTLSPEEFVVWLGGISIQPAEKRVAGYAVRVTHSGADASATERKRAIADVMMKSVRRLREKQ